MLWDEDTKAIFAAIISFWFGSRAIDKAKQMKIIKDALSEELISSCVDVYEELDYRKFSIWWDTTRLLLLLFLPTLLIGSCLKYKNIFGFGKETISVLLMGS